MKSTDHNIQLRWTSHQLTVFNVFQNLFNSESLVDVTLAVEGKYLRAHKIILSACSPYFHELLALDDSKQPIIFMSPDTKFKALKAILDFMYKGDVQVHYKDLPDLLKLAESLQIRGLVSLKFKSNENLSSDLISPQSHPVDPLLGSEIKSTETSTPEVEESMNQNNNFQDLIKNIVENKSQSILYNPISLHRFKDSVSSNPYKRICKDSEPTIISSDTLPEPPMASISIQLDSDSINVNETEVPYNNIAQNQTSRGQFEIHTDSLVEVKPRSRWMTEEEVEVINVEKNASTSAVRTVLMSGGEFDQDQRTIEKQEENNQIVSAEQTRELHPHTDASNASIEDSEEVVPEVMDFQFSTLGHPVSSVRTSSLTGRCLLCLNHRKTSRTRCLACERWICADHQRKIIYCTNCNSNYHKHSVTDVDITTSTFSVPGGEFGQDQRTIEKQEQNNQIVAAEQTREVHPHTDASNASIEESEEIVPEVMDFQFSTLGHPVSFVSSVRTSSVKGSCFLCLNRRKSSRTRCLACERWICADHQRKTIYCTNCNSNYHEHSVTDVDITTSTCTT